MKKFLLSLLMFPAFALAGTYPLDTCIVSGEKLGEMGPPFVLNYKGTEVRLCCDRCQAKFEKNPEKYLARLAEASKSGN